LFNVYLTQKLYIIKLLLYIYKNFINYTYFLNTNFFDNIYNDYNSKVHIFLKNKIKTNIIYIFYFLYMIGFKNVIYTFGVCNIIFKYFLNIDYYLNEKKK